MDLPGLFLLEPPQLVRELNGHGRLDEERRTRMGFVVDDSAHIPLALSANRYDVAPVSYAYGSVGHPDPLRQIRYKRLELPHDLVSRAT